MKEKHSILFFDGGCNLCNKTVQFIIRHDKKRQFLFATLQSSLGKKAIANVASGGKIPDTVILFYNGSYYTKSTAVIRILMLLGGLRKLSIVGFILPAFIRDKMYDWIASNRYQWFGKKQICLMPTPELQSRFLED